MLSQRVNFVRARGFVTYRMQAVCDVIDERIMRKGELRLILNKMLTDLTVCVCVCGEHFEGEGTLSIADSHQAYSYI